MRWYTEVATRTGLLAKHLGDAKDLLVRYYVQQNMVPICYNMWQQLKNSQDEGEKTAPTSHNEYTAALCGQSRNFHQPTCCPKDQEI